MDIEVWGWYVMENADKLPFKVGDLAESKSFQQGYRGAWFRCKIVQIRQRKGYIEYALEYYDFPDEKLKWMKLYQIPIWSRSNKRKKELMIRPHYPSIFNMKEVPDVSLIAEVTVIFNDAWKRGDLVDWWTTGCYWSGTIIEIFSNESGRIELYRPPHGEGLQYDVFFKDVRPSLDWSPEFGWKVLDKKVNYGGKPCAWILRPTNPEAVLGGSSKQFPFSADVLSSDSDESKMEENAEIENQFPFQKDSEKNAHGDNSKMTRSIDGESSSEFNRVEAAVLDLQQCLNRVKLLRAVLQKSRTSPVTPRPRWKFVPPSYSSDDPGTEE